MAKMSIKNIKKLDKLSYLNSFQINYQDKKGKARCWEFVSRQGLERLKAEIEDNASFCDGATIFATDRKKEKVVLIKEYRVSQGRYLYSLPAGLSDTGETLAEAAIREFKEETGLDLEIVTMQSPRYTSVGLSNEKVAFVYGYFSGQISNQYCTDNEDIEVIIADKKMAEQLLAEKEVPIRTALALNHFYNLNPFFKEH